MFGRRVKRVEDPALLRGEGRFADDIHYPGMLHAHFVRSPYAHARIAGIDAAAARAMSGVHAIYALQDLAPHLTDVHIPGEMPSAAIRQTVRQTVLADGEVCHVGEAVAMVVAEDRATAEDAAEQVMVDYEPLPAVVDPRAALDPDAPQARLTCPDNLLARFVQDFGDADAAFAGADHVFAASLRQHKGGGHPIECRGLVAHHEPAEDHLTVWDGAQMAHRAHGILVQMLGCGERDVRLVPPDVGGGFGPKFVFYAEEAAVPLAAKLLCRPVKWIEDRREHFVATTQERDQLWDVEVAVDADGRLRGVRGRMVHDHGAYTPYGIVIAQNSATSVLGPYVLPACRLEVLSVLTNLIPATPTRGAGRPQGTFVIERLLDRVADELSLDRTEVRRRNLIGADQMPYVTPVRSRDGLAITYDSGDYPACQADLLAAMGYDGFPAEQAAARDAGRYIGLGVANYVEGTGRGPYESAIVSVGPSGRIEIRTGATAQGQGVKTTLAQLCAGILGVAPADVSVIAGDTAAISHGQGAFASRQAVNAGSSVHLAAHEVRDKALETASRLLEAAKEDLELADGAVRVAGVAGLSLSLAE
ncbi:MAG: xanthine dehydrogenase family protein molybdopterin-binding subunit, partial [Alphaproteobacteria bacterium]|nr:xanthine dehydrogenase family protein molybdopterin-binding subunit [Alphaproteobacteria bacterium]